MAQHGAHITLKTLQKILHFNSLDALVTALTSKYIKVDIATETNGGYTKITTDSVAKYIANQYVGADQQQR